MIIISNILAGCLAPIAAYVLRSIGQQPGAASGLILGGDIVRYLFSIFPVFNLSYSFIGIAQLQTSNNVCKNNIDALTLENLCAAVVNGGDLDPSQFEYYKCCGPPYVDESLQLCGKIDILPCVEIKSFFTWDQLNGINICLIWMFGCSVLYIGILVLIETGVIKRILSGSKNIVSIHIHSQMTEKTI